MEAVRVRRSRRIQEAQEDEDSHFAKLRHNAFNQDAIDIPSSYEEEENSSQSQRETEHELTNARREEHLHHGKPKHYSST